MRAELVVVESGRVRRDTAYAVETMRIRLAGREADSGLAKKDRLYVRSFVIYVEHVLKRIKCRYTPASAQHLSYCKFARPICRLVGSTRLDCQNASHMSKCPVCKEPGQHSTPESVDVEGDQSRASCLRTRSSIALTKSSYSGLYVKLTAALL